MVQTREELTVHLAERLYWQVARRDDSRVARHLARKQVVDGVFNYLIRHRFVPNRRFPAGCS
jgi:hypothetical protein